MNTADCSSASPTEWLAPSWTPRTSCRRPYLRWDTTDAKTIDTPIAFLRTVVTRLSIDHLRRAKKTREVYEGLWLPEPYVDTPSTNHDELSESLSTAFLVLLENLAPPERAAFLLMEVFGYTYSEIADTLEKSEANCRQIVKRAKDRIQEYKPRHAIDPAEHERLVSEFIAASQEQNMDRFSAILAEDAVLYTDHGGKVIANKRAIFGAVNIGRFIHGLMKRFRPENYRMEARIINGTQGLVAYEGDKPSSVTTFAIQDGHIQTIYTVPNPDKLAALRPNGN
ncbi:MAG: sigma-70 family RNA polymerase sigma factor [Candidatus Hydrogenedentota bacterium]